MQLSKWYVVFADEEVDGEAFMTLTESDFKDLAKKIGIVRKLLALQEKVSQLHSKIKKKSTP